MGTSNISLGNLPRTVAIEASDGGVVFRFVDQRLLPARLIYLETSDWREVVEAISHLAVRGAPAIGIAGAAALALWASGHAATGTMREDADALAECAEEIVLTRPTAVNLSWTVDRASGEALDMLERGLRWDAVAQRLCDLVGEMIEEDERANRLIGENGVQLIGPGSRVLTHCNAGSLATAFYGTALGVVYSAAQRGNIARVYADETRPVGQGARLTAWELSRAGVPVTLICDNMAASLMALGQVDAVIVGADRIAANGDVANKIGTYGVAVLASHHHVPFYVAAPASTIDYSVADGTGIVIEQRAAEEILPDAIEGVDVWNPAFDVTPANLITAIITEKGVHDPACLMGIGG